MRGLHMLGGAEGWWVRREGGLHGLHAITDESTSMLWAGMCNSSSKR